MNADKGGGVWGADAPKKFYKMAENDFPQGETLAWGDSLWDRLRVLIDNAADVGAVVHAFDAHKINCGSTQVLADRGGDVLRSALAKWWSIGKYGNVPQNLNDPWVWQDLTGDASLARLFSVLGFDGRLRNHHKALSSRCKAAVMRTMAGEVDQALALEASRRSAPWQVSIVQLRELLETMAEALGRLADRSYRSLSFSQLRYKMGRPDPHMIRLLR